MVDEYTVFSLQTHDSIENLKSVLCTGIPADEWPLFCSPTAGGRTVVASEENSIVESPQQLNRRQMFEDQPLESMRGKVS